MKKRAKLLFFGLAVWTLAGCTGGEAGEKPAEEALDSSAVVDTTMEQETEQMDSAVSSESEGAVVDTANEATEQPDEEATAESADDSAYSAEEVEYARVWLQLGPNPDIETLYVERIPAGTLINPLDETSVVYPEEVIQLSGSRLVDGSVTYSGNGDGTINVYNVPLRWESNPSPEAGEDFMKEYTQKISENTELVYVEPATGEEVEALIEKIQLY
ncbi:hypothetical protein [Atopococcus tabaci]|uniref:hypothetical protein n=1 Tax=Atopococcus tabaci TaxID=269774 RepID=UPI000481F06E|nr:hypothetical protein [Atopococcus tabaci]